MPRFFVPHAGGEAFEILGEDARHIIKSLRMHAGEIITVSDGSGTDFGCSITGFAENSVSVKVLYSQPSQVEPNIGVTLYQGLPKGDKMDLIVQKTVELGIARIVPVLTARCVSRPDNKSAAKKQERWQKIAEEAAKQSGRGIIPQVAAVTGFAEAVRMQGGKARKIVFYEGGGEPLKSALEPQCEELALFIGPEGGWEKEEIQKLEEAGCKKATLGPRILRTETAPIAALSAIMFETGNFDLS